ncbi:unnamed protein product [Brugia pahangi]|uniref:LRRNT_2 domain-containing protein n=1 Tax=Brugia pahangi TaxID=6280 RepID=A0A0N4T149_BRUPA|nr:unnamed protein product [Brugia pahangi]
MIISQSSRCCVLARCCLDATELRVWSGFPGGLLKWMNGNTIKLGVLCNLHDWKGAKCCREWATPNIHSYGLNLRMLRLNDMIAKKLNTKEGNRPRPFGLKAM